MDLSQRFARLATVTAARWPVLWPVFRRPLRRMFDALAPEWDAARSGDRLRAFEAGLDTLPVAPRRALDLGTGTGDGAFVIARRWRETEVLGLDLSGPMVAEARAKTPPDLDGRVRFDAADASRLPIADDWADLVTLNNMIPFFDELARVTAPAGHVLIAYSRGPQTPIYVRSEQVRSELERRGFENVREVAAGSGTAVVGRRGGARRAARKENGADA